MSEDVPSNILTLQFVGTAPAIPTPKPRQTDDVDPATYVPNKMTEEQRTTLRSAGVKVSDFLANMPKMPAPLDVANEASANMRHYRTANGSTRSYDMAKTEEILAQADVRTPVSMALDDVTRVFVSQVIATAATSGPGVSQYLAINAVSTNPGIRGTNWFPMYSLDAKWKYALGGFDFAPAAMVVRDGVFITVRYRIFIYDRYNWDEDKSIHLPFIDPKVFLGSDDFEELSILRPGAQSWESAGASTSPNPYIYESQDYIENAAGKWVPGPNGMGVHDALFGNLINEDLAASYDINGAGQIHTYRVAVSDVDISAAIDGEIPAKTSHSAGAGE